MASYKTVTTTGGNGTIPLIFPDNVPKYDPSSFYNWETDNRPLWSLEQRGDTLFQAMGSPGGNPAGITFVLSSTGNVDESRGIYDNIYDIVERIPKRLKFPVLIELCTYGNLGKLDLANITCEGDGIIEVRNQAYIEDVNASAFAVKADVSGGGGGKKANGDLTAGSGIPYIYRTYSKDASAMMFDVSSSRSGTLFGDSASWNSNAHIVTIQGPDTDRQSQNLTVHIASGNTSMVVGANNGLFQLQPYAYAQDFSVTKDAAAFYGSSTTDYMVGCGGGVAGIVPLAKRGKRAVTMTQGQSTLVGYGNYFSAVSIKDCQGDIVMRNVHTDGSNHLEDRTDAAGVRHIVDYGFNIENSEVILDNTAAFRNIKAGYNFKNSRIKITGHCIAWRIYTKSDKGADNRLKDGTGMFSVNTDILWDSTYYDQSRKYINWFGKTKRGMDLRNSTVRGGIKSDLLVTSALPNGGSQLRGRGESSAEGTSLVNCSGAGGDIKTTILQTSECNEDGIYLEGTDFEFDGRINTFLNVGNGITARRSQIRLPQITSNNNSGYGISLEGSQFTYGGGSDDYSVRPDDYSNASVKTAGTADTAGTRVPGGTMYTQTAFGGNSMAANDGLRLRNRAQFHVDSNNQNVLVDKSSSISPAQMDFIPQYFGRWGGCDWVVDSDADANADVGLDAKYGPMNHFGATPYRINNKPGIVVTNNSDAEFVNVNYAADSNDTCKGKIGIVSNGSNMIFRGTSGCATTFNFYPVADTDAQFRSWMTAGIVATDNSTLELTGPTKTARFGVPFLAENSSHLLVKPPTLVGTDNILDVSGYNLIQNNSFAASSNHTALEVHSTRACLVANRKSGIELKSLGGLVTSVGGVQIASVDIRATGYEAAAFPDTHNQYLQSTSGGYVKFYPNGFTSATMAAQFNSAVKMVATSTDTFDVTKRFLAPEGDMNDLTTGGMCVRAVEDSSVDVNLVDFHMFVDPSAVSGTHYNLVGRGCGKGEDIVVDGGGGGTNPPPGTSGTATNAGDPDAVGGGGGGAVDGQTGIFEPLPTGNSNDPDWSNTMARNAANVLGQVLNETGQGNLLTAAAVGTGEGGSGKALMTGTTNFGSMSVIGDERGRGANGGAGTDLAKYYKEAYYAFSSNGTTSDTSWNQIGVNKSDIICLGSRIHIWNIADTSRIHAANCLINGSDPMTASLGITNYHGPTGKWWNGVSLDYYGLGGRRSTYGALGAGYFNCGIYRLMMSTRGDLKGFYDVSSLSGTNSGSHGWHDTAASGGSFVDQVNGQGYTHWTQNVRFLGNADQRRITGTDSDYPQGIYQTSSCMRVFGWGMPSNLPDRGVATMQPRLGGFSAYNAVSGNNGNPDKSWIYTTAEPATPLPAIGMDSLGFMRNWLDDTGANLFQNAKHLAEDKVNGVSIYRSHRGAGGEGRDSDTDKQSFGVGVRSLNLFDLDRLV